MSSFVKGTKYLDNLSNIYIIDDLFAKKVLTRKIIRIFLLRGPQPHVAKPTNTSACKGLTFVTSLLPAKKKDIVLRHGGLPFPLIGFLGRAVGCKDRLH